MITLVVVIIPPPQLKVTPAVVDVAVSVSLRFVQVKTVGGMIPALGGIVFWVTVTEAVLVQPFAGSVTVTL